MAAAARSAAIWRSGDLASNRERLVAGAGRNRSFVVRRVSVVGQQRPAAKVGFRVGWAPSKLAWTNRKPEVRASPSASAPRVLTLLNLHLGRQFTQALPRWHPQRR